MGLLNIITVEPVMFLQQTGDTLTSVIYQNLFIDKICKIDLGYGAPICDLYEKSTNISEFPFLTPLMNEIQTKSSEFSMYNSLVESLLPVFLVLFLGVWSDQNRRRKPTMILSLVGKLVRTVGLLLNAYFTSWPSYVLLLTAAFPMSLGGGNAVFQMSAFSYIADSSTPSSRTWRIGVIEVFWHLGSPIGIYLGAYLFQVGGYFAVFGASLVCHLAGVLYATFILPEVPAPDSLLSQTGKYTNNNNNYGSTFKRIRSYSENDTDMEAAHGSAPTGSSLTNKNNNGEKEMLLKKDSHQDSQEEQTTGMDSVYELVVGSLRAIIKKRPNHMRKCLLALGGIMLLLCTASNGESSMKYLFTRNKFSWREQEFSTWNTFETAVGLVGLIIVMPLFNKLLKLSDPCAGALGALSRLASRLCYGLAPKAIYMYVGSAIEVAGIMAGLGARSLASKCVPRSERGRIFAFLGCIEALVPLLAVPLYTAIYTSTLTYLPSAIYFTSTGLYTLMFLVFGTIFVALKMNVISFTKYDDDHTSSEVEATPQNQEKKAFSNILLPPELYRTKAEQTRRSSLS